MTLSLNYTDPRASAEKFPGQGAMENPRPRNSTNTPAFTLSVAGYGAHWAYTSPRVHLKVTLH